MSPIERVRARSAALQALGLGQYASPEQIRDAWKRIAFRTHPDRNANAHDAFASAKSAYDLLMNQPRMSQPAHTEPPAAPTRRSAAGTRLQARPKIKTRKVPLSPDAVAECKALLDRQTEAAPNGASSTIVVLENGGSGLPRDAGAAKDHVPDALHRCGRKLTYIVRAPLAEGQNRVALPTSVLDGSRKVKPMIVTFLAPKAGPGEIRVPDAIRLAVFPGARGVDIRFSDC